MDATTLRNTLIAIGAIIMALETGLKGAPTFRASLPRFLTSEKWNFVPVILLSVAFLIWIVRGLGNPKQAQQSMAISSPTPAVEPSSSSIAESGRSHIGTTFSLQLAQMLGRLPKPCTIKVTTQSNDDLVSVIVWVVSYGNLSGGAICSLVGNDTEPPDIDNSQEPRRTSDPGIVVHWDAASIEAQPIAHFFDSCGVKTSVSHRLPSNPSPNLIWIDIGPGSPWK